MVDWDKLVEQAVKDGRMPPGTMLMIVPRYKVNELGGRELDEEATLEASLLVTNISKGESDV